MAHLINVTSTDKNGTFEYKGDYVMENEKGLTMRLGVGDLFFEKGSYTVEYPKGFKKPERRQAAKKVVEKVKAETKAREPKKGTKIAIAVELIKGMKAEKEDATRQELIHHLMDKMEIADKVKASSLYQTAIKRI